MKQPSEVLRRILAAVRNPDVSTRELGMMLPSEPGLVERLFRYIELYYAWIGTEHRDPVRATTLLGPKVIGPVVIQHMLVTSVDPEVFPQRMMSAYWTATVWRASAARALAGHLADSHQDEAFSLGFGLEYGSLPLMERTGQFLRWVREVHATVGVERRERELQLLRESHEQSMVRTGQAWGIPKDYLYMIAVHAQPIDKVPKERRELWAAVSWADRLVQAMTSSASSVHLERWANEVHAELALSLNDAWGIIEGVLAKSKAVADMLGVEIGEQPTLEILRGRDGQTPETMDREALLALVVLLEEDNQRLQKERDAARQDVVDLRSTDAITRTPSHEAFMRALERDLDVARRAEKPLVLLWVNIDDFISVNVHAGYEGGNKVLERVADLLTKALRQRDRVGRVGAGDFAVLLNSDERGGHLVAERVRAGVEAARIDMGEERLRVTIRVMGGPLIPEFRDALHWVTFLERALKKPQYAAGNRVYWLSSLGETRP